MFESSLVPPAGDGAAGQRALHVPKWSELSARLAAARDLRRSLGQDSGRSAGSFARFAAQEGQALNAEPGFVNLTGLADGKGDQGTRPASEVAGPVPGHIDGFTRADREMR